MLILSLIFNLLFAGLVYTLLGKKLNLRLKPFLIGTTIGWFLVNYIQGRF